jgi:hypothetical protein
MQVRPDTGHRTGTRVMASGVWSEQEFEAEEFFEWLTS